MITYKNTNLTAFYLVLFKSLLKKCQNHFFFCIKTAERHHNFTVEKTLDGMELQNIQVSHDTKRQFS